MALTSNKIYKYPNGINLMIPILLSIIYFIVSIIILNNNFKLFLVVPFILILLILKILWDQSNHFFAIIFTVCIFLSIFILYSISKQTNASVELQILYNKYQYENLSNQKYKNYNDSINDVNKKSSLYNIFFIETNHKTLEYTTKQLCSIESAAKNNPNARVFVMSIKSEFKDMNLIQNYPNLVRLKFKPVELFNNTPLWSWWEKGQVFRSAYMIAHISDAARLALLYKYGGFYSDLDTISVKSFEPLTKKSGAGYLNENGPSLGNGFLHFIKKHPYLTYIMNEFQANYNPNYWGQNGPTLLINTLKSYCNSDNIYDLFMTINPEHNYETNMFRTSRKPGFSQTKSNKFENKCGDFVIYPESYFYPYTYLNGELSILFEKNAFINISRIINSYSVHFYGSLSINNKVNINDFSIYEYLAMQNCPVTYDYVKRNSIVFE